MLTAKQLARMRDHNGLPVVFSEYSAPDFQGAAAVRFIVEPERIAGKIGACGASAGERVCYVPRYAEGVRVSCRSRAKVGREIYGGYQFPGDAFVWLTTGEIVPVSDK